MVVSDRGGGAIGSCIRDTEAASRGAHGWVLVRLFKILISIAIAVSILTVSFTLLLTPLPTQVFSEMFANDAISLVSHEELVETACDTLAYVNGDQSVELPLGSDYRVSYTADVMAHLDDVRSLFAAIKVAAAISLCVLAVLVALSRILMRKGTEQRSEDPAAQVRDLSRRFRSLLAFSFKTGVKVLIALVAILVIVALVDFDALFGFLHSLFFSAGTWTFPANSLLICALPEEFWMSMGILWAVTVIVMCAVLLIVARRLPKTRDARRTRRSDGAS